MATAAGCTAPTNVIVNDEMAGGAGLADNEYDVHWTPPGECAGIDHYTVVLTVCSASGPGACKSLKVDAACCSESNIFLSGAKGIASKSNGDTLTVTVQAKHAAGANNGMHGKSDPVSCIIGTDC